MYLPRHLAIIMDGNGRWARQRGLPRILGHQQGVDVVRGIVEECSKLGISWLTLYAFSSENWGRPEEEVEALMGLLVNYLRNELDTMLKHGIRLNVIGDIGRMPLAVAKMLQESMERTREQKGMVLTLALSYGARDEITRAVRKIAAAAASGEITADRVSEQMVGDYLDTAGLPDPDLLIRTSGEMRISNFLLWQLAYTELYFTEALWPDFKSDHLRQALHEYNRRERRFGLTGEQMKKEGSKEEGGRH
ncbi:Undecaprenyl pyrophosphate synthetase [Geoalkalibacter ferrihydriticus]|uniref:Isoprenyl transferase n=2 Tax=Geoalkalibacter ferrihydriticus TaxID=392333 RepID=A0A0C2EDC8_9BACT|nr:isoprenyl transferase [Geoalkalibacter ferrihydriticus]KIH76593.1 UDP pyrophosphate synthase [Geoalkalibacter ferrihydriticus DSM 17813]SDM02795.1 Undecaprenyl pyrophosphate synthetase [Geoalkalibacter ferrihydriticus]